MNDRSYLCNVLTGLQEDVKKLKSTQPSIGDSSKLYRQTFDKVYLSTETGYSRLYKIECIPKREDAAAIFMVNYLPEPSVMFPMSGSFAPTSTDRVIYFAQNKLTGDEELYIISRPRSVTIYSNVDFDIRWELIYELSWD